MLLRELLLKKLRKYVVKELATALEKVVELLDSSVAQQAGEKAAAQLLKHVRTALDGGLQKQVKRAIFGRAQELFNKVGSRSLRSQAKRLDKVEESMAAALKKKCKKGEEATQKLVARFTGGGLRAALLRNALKAATKYEVRVGGVTGSFDMIKLAWTRTKMELVKDENQLSYLKDKLTKLEDMTVTEQTWKDAAETWVAVLGLRSQIQVERGQAVLECMCADEKVLKAIGAAVQMSETNGEVPNDIVTLLSKGPSAHIRNEAYKYHKKIDAELARVRHIREIQVRFVAFIGTAFAAALLASGNVIGRVYNQLMIADGRLAAIVAGAVVVGLLLCCLLVGSVCYTCRPRGGR